MSKTYQTGLIQESKDGIYAKIIHFYLTRVIFLENEKRKKRINMLKI